MSDNTAHKYKDAKIVISSNHRLTDFDDLSYATDLFYRVSIQHVRINFRSMVADGWPEDAAIRSCCVAGDGQLALRTCFNFDDTDIRRLISKEKCH